AGVAPNRPRVPKDTGIGLLLGGGLGALVGAALSDRDVAERAALGAAGGAALGMLAAAGTHVMSLERSLRSALAQIGAEFVSLRRYGRYRVQLVFNSGSGFKTVGATADDGREWTADQLDDWYYRRLVIAVAEKMGASK